MAAEVAALTSIATGLASGLLTEVFKKLINTTPGHPVLRGFISGSDLKRHLDRLKRELHKMQALLDAVDGLQSAHKNELVLLWVGAVRDGVYDADDLLDEMTYENLRKRRDSFERKALNIFFQFCSAPVDRVRMARKIEKVMSIVAEIFQEAQQIGLRPVEVVENQSIDRSGRLFDDLSEHRANVGAFDMVGRDQDVSRIVQALCCPDKDHDLAVVAIVGMSGLGKTTLAKAVFEREAVQQHFGERIWLFVSYKSNLTKLLNEMVESVAKVASNLSNMDAIIRKLQDCLKEKKYLLVLDDVWDMNWEKWESVKDSLRRVGGLSGSTVLVTTRNHAVANTMQASLVHLMEELSEDDSWDLFKQKAFANKTPEKVTSLEVIGKRIVKKCKGVPLAIKTLGCLLQSKDEEQDWYSVEHSELWNFSENESRILPSLMLSFNHLSNTSLKLCFAYCSIILPKGFRVKEDTLVQLWMAQGFLQQTPGSSLTMEDIGKQYAVNLLNCCLLIEHDRDMYGRLEYGMHDLVYDLAFYVSGATSQVGRDIGVANGVHATRHLLIPGELEKDLFSSAVGESLCKLRTVFSFAKVPNDLLVQARFLRVLMIMNCGLEEVPTSIGRLRHLRYLSLVGNPIASLPESVTKLYHLQTLQLEDCNMLSELPKHLSDLVNLKHIATTRHVGAPEGIGQLTSLQSLPRLNLQAGGGWKIQELEFLQNIRGVLSIKGLENVKRRDDAVQANLVTKQRIDRLLLIWRSRRSTAGNGNDQDILDGLQPNPSLTTLGIEGFDGKRFPPWLSCKIFVKLRMLRLSDCRNCEELPTLGHLPGLESVFIEQMQSLKFIGIGFFYDEKDDGIYGNTKKTLFPALKTLRLIRLPSLTIWSEPLGNSALIFPQLEVLTIRNCPQLTAVPTHFPLLKYLSIGNIGSSNPFLMIWGGLDPTHLTSLRIENVSGLKTLPPELSRCTSLQKIKISGCIDLVDLSHNLCALSSLTSFEVQDCENMKSLPDLYCLPSLHELQINCCTELRSLPNGLEGCTSLENLFLFGCTNLELIPNLTLMSNLGSLSIVDFRRQTVLPSWFCNLSSLRVLVLGRFDNSLDEFPDISHLLKSLRFLTIFGWPKLRSLPCQLQMFTDLQELGIFDFDEIEALPDWLGDLSSLEVLKVWDCKNLKSLPGSKTMAHLSNLRELSIGFCPKLEGRLCKDTASEEWQKIVSIPLVTINNKEVHKLS